MLRETRQARLPSVSTKVHDKRHPPGENWCLPTLVACPEASSASTAGLSRTNPEPSQPKGCPGMPGIYIDPFLVMRKTPRYPTAWFSRFSAIACVSSDVGRNIRGRDALETVRLRIGRRRRADGAVSMMATGLDVLTIDPRRGSRVGDAFSGLLTSVEIDIL